VKNTIIVVTVVSQETLIVVVDVLIVGPVTLVKNV
jgi:hypothetical protein